MQRILRSDVTEEWRDPRVHKRPFHSPGCEHARRLRTHPRCPAIEAAKTHAPNENERATTNADSAGTGNSNEFVPEGSDRLVGGSNVDSGLKRQPLALALSRAGKTPCTNLRGWRPIPSCRSIPQRATSVMSTAEGPRRVAKTDRVLRACRTPTLVFCSCLFDRLPKHRNVEAIRCLVFARRPRTIKRARSNSPAAIEMVGRWTPSISPSRF